MVRLLIIDKGISAYFPFSPWGYTILPPHHLRGNLPKKHTGECMEIEKDCLGCFHDGDTVC
jgi:hypothetical protein